MKFLGKLVSGLGEGSFYVKKYGSIFRKKLGFLPFPGTLNLEVVKVPELARGLSLSPGGDLKSVHCYRASLKANGREIACVLVRPEATRHPKNIVEFVAPVDIRQTLNVRDGDFLECEA